jgi:hypothetical protein
MVDSMTDITKIEVLTNKIEDTSIVGATESTSSNEGTL